MGNILYDVYKRYINNQWLSPFERAMARLLHMFVVTFIVGMLPAVGSALQSINTTGGLQHMNWSVTVTTFITMGLGSVIMAVWKYGNAKAEGSQYPASESSKSIEDQIFDALDSALPRYLEEFMGVQQHQQNAPAAATASVVTTPVASMTVPVNEPASDAATPNNTAGAGYAGGMGQETVTYDSSFLVAVPKPSDVPVDEPVTAVVGKK